MLATNKRAQQKLEKLKSLSWELAAPIQLQRGDLLIIDNRKAAHARSRFTANFDGNDRWIQRSFAICNKRYLTEKLGANQRIFELAVEL